MILSNKNRLYVFLYVCSLRFPMMTQRDSRSFAKFLVIFGLLAAFAASRSLAEGPTPEATAAFHTYVGTVESRLAQQHRSKSAFLAATAYKNEARLRGGEFIVEELTPAGGAALPGAILHDWRGTAFAAGATAADFERVMKNFSAYPRYFSPQVVQARVISQKDDSVQAVMRVRQKHVITVVMDTAYDVSFGQLDDHRGYSLSRSTQISEIDSPGTTAERELSVKEEHGFLWRLNTYWSYEERDGGLYLQIESVSLTRSIPRGLGWVVQPFVESVPRESLEFTLRSTCNALRSAAKT
jgi:hypothetical protein